MISTLLLLVLVLLLTARVVLSISNMPASTPPSTPASKIPVKSPVQVTSKVPSKITACREKTNDPIVLNETTNKRPNVIHKDKLCRTNIRDRAADKNVLAPLPVAAGTASEPKMCSTTNACVNNGYSLNISSSTLNVRLTGFRSEKSIVNGCNKARSIPAFQKTVKCLDNDKLVSRLVFSNKTVSKKVGGNDSGRNVNSTTRSLPATVSRGIGPRTTSNVVPRTTSTVVPKTTPTVVPTVGLVPSPDMIQCLTVVSRKGPMYGLLFGAFCVTTGKQIATRRFRTECQIFFRVGVLPHLEAQRDEKLTDRVVRFQAHCRGFLARKKFAKRKVEQLAVCCIQRNVRKFLSVRNWPWWRLLVRVMPLLNVHRTEEELRAKTEELENLRNKFEKLEQEKSLLKLETSKLEAKLSELTMDLAEEHSSAALANQRLKIESAEKLRLEKELNEIQKERKQLQDSSDRMELELMYSRNSEMNGTSELESEFGEEDSAYKQRYERAMRELEFTRRRLQQQHQDDLEQLIALKKQLEKKLADAYEEVEEQRQVVGQWKRKVQKLTSEMNDLRLLLEKQNSRNDMLEKKQRKFDTEIQLLTDELRQEKTSKDRAAREKELALGDKYTMEQNMSAMKLELEMKEQKINSLTAEINELSFGGNTEEEIGLLKKAKHQLTNKVKEQEEELDDLAGQVQLLETAKLRLEMSLEQIRKENKKELAQRDEELEEVRCNAHKKVKALECQLENEHEERTLLLRERHEMERKLAEYEERSHATRNSDQELLQKLRRDLKRTKALLRDAQTTIEQSRTETPNKTLIRQLRNQLEDAECARALAVKARQAAEAERSEALATLEDAVRARSEAEDRASAMMRERTQLQSQLDENEEELADVLKKYRATVQQLSNEQISLQEQAGRVAELETERASLREQLAELSTRVESMETLNDPNSSLAVKRLQLKTKELESKLELEQTTRSRLEVQINRLKENNERLQSDIEILKAREHSAQEKAKSSNRLVRELREENTLLTSKEHEAQAKIRELDKSVESAEADAAAARTDLRLALQRIEDLQCAIQGDMEDADDNSGASSDSDSSIRSDEVLNTCASLTHPGSGDSSYQSVERSSSQLRKLNDSVTKDSSLA